MRIAEHEFDIITSILTFVYFLSMASKVTRGDIVLYTVMISTVGTPTEITTDKTALDEYVKKSTLQ